MKRSFTARKLSRSGLIRNWKQRHFVLSDSHLTYYSDSLLQDKKGEYRLTGDTLTKVHDEASNQFEISNKEEGVLRIESSSHEEMHDFMAAVRFVCRNL